MAFIYIFLGTLAIMQEIAYITEASIRYQSNSAKIDNELKLRDIRPIYEEEYHKKCSDNICEMPDFYYPKEIIENLLKSPSSIFKTLVNNSKEFPDAVLQSRTPSKEENICRYFVLYHLPGLRFLDSNKVEEQELVEAKRRGQFMNVIRPKMASTADNRTTRLERDLKYSPLPRSLRNPQDYKGVYGRCRYRYSGKHSEGNRFICNNDL
ncbi:hypothetical protein GWI33_010628 [Rhynchophorus ferrugineus]|uniref:Uncharacterized protein n=1 Tax=Rhynchophorus ferrugineus TaxID=354439 RepID=A0A834ISV6_RHYFE|nr:hypothetical protein GWI33_010628 [Rhynchophorus ferrugineus]